MNTSSHSWNRARCCCWSFCRASSPSSFCSFASAGHDVGIMTSRAAQCLCCRRVARSLMRLAACRAQSAIGWPRTDAHTASDRAGRVAVHWLVPLPLRSMFLLREPPSAGFTFQSAAPPSPSACSRTHAQTACRRGMRRAWRYEEVASMCAWPSQSAHTTRRTAPAAVDSYSCRLRAIGPWRRSEEPVRRRRRRCLRHCRRLPCSARSLRPDGSLAMLLVWSPSSVAHPSA